MMYTHVNPSFKSGVPWGGGGGGKLRGCVIFLF